MNLSPDFSKSLTLHRNNFDLITPSKPCPGITALLFLFPTRNIGHFTLILRLGHLFWCAGIKLWTEMNFLVQVIMYYTLHSSVLYIVLYIAQHCIVHYHPCTMY
jgi:hypothetical protein